MSKQPSRQFSLQHIPKTSQITKQKSADEKHSDKSNISQYHTVSDQLIRSKIEKSSWESFDRPKVRIAWSPSIEKEAKVEVIASRIGTATNRTMRNNPAIIGTDKTTILYSRQELAERLRLAWKQREANKSNIDIFLARDMTTEERCDSRMSSSSVNDIKNHDNREDSSTKPKMTFSNDIPPSSSLPMFFSSHSSERDDNHMIINARSGTDKEVKLNIPQDAKSKRRSFQSGMNFAFTGNIQKITSVSQIIREASDKLDKSKDRSIAIRADQKPKRTYSAPSLHRRIDLSNTRSITGPSRSRVKIIIDTPKIPKEASNFVNIRKIERKDSKDSGKLSLDSDDILFEKNNSQTINQITPLERIKLVSNKKRSRNGKRKADNLGKKNEQSKSNPDIVTMVSLVSDADSDSEIDRNSPRDDKLVKQLRSNFPTTPIIKSCPLIINIGNLSSSESIVNNLLIPKRVLKSVSFQQDSVEDEMYIRSKSVDNKLLISDSLSKITQPDEIVTTWQSQMCINKKLSTPSSLPLSPLSLSFTSSSSSPEPPPLPPSPLSSSVLPANYQDDFIDTSQILTDREKRCLIVPISDPRDKKRKLLLQRTKSALPRPYNEGHEPSIVQIGAKEFGSEHSVITEGVFNEVSSVGNTASVALTGSISKIIDRDILDSENVKTAETDVDSVKPQLKTTKEKECWHLYRKICDKGVCVSFDTVLRGMLTPTEYRLRRREISY